jgi:hypothetical protein
MVWDRIVVKNFWGKLMDPCGCYRLKKPFIKLKKHIYKKQRGDIVKRVKP